MKNKLKIWCISDTHGQEDKLNVPDNIDMVCHAGDMGTFKNPNMNEPVIRKFINWYKSLDIKYKLVCAGNHDSSIESGLIIKSDFGDIIYGEHETIEVAGLKIFLSPYTPSFNQWAFNVKRNRLDDYWKDIPTDTDVLITHGPPMGILDLTESGLEDYKYAPTGQFPPTEGNKLSIHCGDKALLNHSLRVCPKIHLFGHIHNESLNKNSGIFQLPDCRIKFINASVVDLDYKICNNGFIIEL